MSTPSQVGVPAPITMAELLLDMTGFRDHPVSNVVPPVSASDNTWKLGVLMYGIGLPCLIMVVGMLQG